MYEILKDRQVPAVADRRKVYNFNAMKAGDAIFIPFSDRPRGTVSSAVTMFSKRHGLLFTTRIGAEDGVEGTFVFCVGPKQERAAPRLVAGGAR